MKISSRLLLKGAAWTIGGYGFGQVLRFATNVFMARLLAPDLFGVMLIVNSLVIGIALISDVGIGQNIIYHKDANDPEFYDTAWSLQAIRSVLLWLVTLIVAAPISSFYASPILVYVLPISGFGIVLSGLTSVSRFLLQKRMQVARLTAFEMITSALSSAAYVLFAWLSPSVWALVFGGLFGSAITMIGSFFILTDVKQKFRLSMRYCREILDFGKWIFVSSVVFFLSTNFDRLYLAKVVPLEMLGIYGIARSISELLGMLVLRVGNYVLFPVVALHSQLPRADLHQQLARVRARFVLAAAIGFSFSVTVADLPINILYDHRYQAASWMLPVLITGAWSTILAIVNESTLLGLGKSRYSAIANGIKFAFLLIALPILVNLYGVLGGIIAVSLADLTKYIPILISQKQERFSFGVQDLLLTIVVILLVGLFESLRWALGFGTSFDTLPINWRNLS
jgi:O-antigen/teichoic acid export membrane protein